MTPARKARAASHPRRRQILEAALDCFTRVGFAAATMEDIRAASHASTGSIYHHFSSKEQLAAALYLEALQDYQAGFVAELHDRAEARGAIRALVEYHLAWVQRQPAWARWLLDMGRQAELVQAVEPQVRALNREFSERVLAWLAPHVERGAIRELPAEITFVILIGPAQVFARMWLAGQTEVDLPAAARALGDAAWRALRADDGAARAGAARGPSPQTGRRRS